MFCQNCGKKIEGGDLFCPFCGAKQQQVNPSENGGASFTAGSQKLTRKGLGIAVICVLIVIVLALVLIGSLCTGGPKQVVKEYYFSDYFDFDLEEDADLEIKKAVQFDLKVRYQSDEGKQTEKEEFIVFRYENGWYSMDAVFLVAMSAYL